MKFGLYTAGVDGAGGTATFDYFKVNGSTGCDGGGANTAPVITSATATPTSGFAPLAVGLSAAATDANGDPLTYSWDYDGNGTADATGATASTTFTTAGNKTVKLTVSDGKGGTATRDIPMQVLAADVPQAKLRALVFSKTAGFRHDSIPQGVAAIQALGAEKNWQVDTTEDASLFTDAVLSHYKVVIFVSTTGDFLNDTQQAAFERFIRSGKGYVGIHAAADAEYDWRWYGNLVGAYFRNHPDGTPTATVVVEDTTDPSTAGLPARWSRSDEWYNYKAPSNANGDDYSPRLTQRCARPAEDGRVDLRGERRVRWRRRRPPDRVVPALRRRALVVHGPRPHAGVVQRGGHPLAHRGRHRDRGGRAPVRGLRRRAERQRRPGDLGGDGDAELAASHRCR